MTLTPRANLKKIINILLWLDVASHMGSLYQSECIISEYT